MKKLNKKWVSRLAMALSLSCILSGMSAFAAETEAMDAGEVNNEASAEPLPEKGMGELLEKLDPDTFGGIYMQDDRYIITALDQAAVQSVLSRSRAASEAEIEFAPATYSMTQLEQAKEAILEHADQYHIFAVGLDLTNNAVSVYTSDLSDENKSAIAALCDVANITYREGKEVYSLEGPDDGEADVNADESTEPTPRAVSIYGGNWLLSNQTPSSQWSTLGTSVARKSDGVRGFITCGHGYSTGNTVYYVNYNTLLGTVVHKVRNTYCDASFIKSSQTYTGRTKDNKLITYQGNAVPGEKLYTYGAKGGIQTSVVKDVGVTIYAQSKTEGEQKHTNTFSYMSKGYGGDSGGPLITPYGGNYSISGIQVAHMQTTGGYDEGFAIQWDDIRSQLGVYATYPV